MWYDVWTLSAFLQVSIVTSVYQSFEKVVLNVNVTDKK